MLFTELTEAGTAEGDVRGVASMWGTRMKDGAPIIDTLLRCAKVHMHRLCETIDQSCNLSIPFDGQMEIVAQAHASGPFAINVPLGFRYNIPASAPGLVFFAFNRDCHPIGERNLASSVFGIDERRSLNAVADQIIDCGFASAESDFVGVPDLSCPVFHGNQVIAVLTVSYIETVNSAHIAPCLAALKKTARTLSDALVSG